MKTKAETFLLGLADLIERCEGVEIYYTNDDDGVHIAIEGDKKDCFVGFSFSPASIRDAARSWS